MQDKLKWCAGLKDGLRLAEPSERLSKSYLTESKSSLKRAEKDLGEGDVLWATVVIYYAEYYALYSFLQRIGAKSENHFCSILAVENLLGKEMVETINDHKLKRIDAQYYLKVFPKEKVFEMLNLAKAFVSRFDNFISVMTEDDADSYRKKLQKLLR